MTAHHDLDRQLDDFLREGPAELPYQSFDAVRDRTDQTRQRTFIGPWRTPTMNRYVFGLGAAALVVVGLFLGSQLLGVPDPNTGAPSVEPTATGTPEAATASPEPALPLTQSFTSTVHGISVSYPAGWTAQAATEPWIESTFPLVFGAPHADWLADPALSDELFLAIASQQISELPLEDWVAEQMASEEGCRVTEPITVDGATGLIGADGCDVAVVTLSSLTLGQISEGNAGRGYWIQLYSSGDNPSAVAAYDRSWFEGVLATVQLEPESAAD
jgi:hypothetical protein